MQNIILEMQDHSLDHSLESHCWYLLISTVRFTNIVPRTRNDFLQCKSLKKQAEKRNVNDVNVNDDHHISGNLY